MAQRYPLLDVFLADNGYRASIKRVFEQFDTMDKGTLSLGQASLAMRALGQPIRPRLINVLLERLSPFGPYAEGNLSDKEILSPRTFCRLLSWVKANLLAHHIASTDVFADVAHLTLLTESSFATFWDANQWGVAYPPQEPNDHFDAVTDKELADGKGVIVID